MNTPLLEVNQISAGYGRSEVLHKLSLSVFPGEIVALIGANGAGKTTVLMTVSGFVKVRSGEIRLSGEDIHELSSSQRVIDGIIHVPEGRKIFPRLTVLENLELGAFLQTDKSNIAKRLEFAFTLFPVLKERKKQLGGTLSGGEQQMLAIGRALMNEPKLLILDEPSMGIAPILVQRIFQTIKKLNDDGLTILLVEQNANQALKIANRGYVIETGRIGMTGSGAELINDPRVQELYLGG